MAKSKKKVIEELSRVRFVGPAVAESLYDDYNIRTIADIVELGEHGDLTELKGVGDKKAKIILSSANSIVESEPAEPEEPEEAAQAQEEPEEPAEDEQPEAQEEPEAQEPEAQEPEAEEPEPREEPTRRTNGRARPAAAAAAGGPAAAAGAAGAGREGRVAGVEQRPDTRSLRDRFIDTLRCPACGHDRFDVGATTMTCQACQRQFNLQDGIADLAPPAPADRSLAQRVMESRTYTRFYEEFFRPRLTRVVTDRSMREEYRLAADFLDFDSEEVRLLDVGCGTGNFTRYLAQRLGLAETPVDAPGLPLVVGMDLSWPMLENARRNIQQENLEDKVFLLRGDGTRIPVRRGAYNRLHCAGSLHLMADIDEALRNFARVLEANGICVIGTFVLGKGIIRRMLKRVAEFPTDFHWFSRDELFRRIERAGFEVVDSSLAGDAITVKARRI